MLITDLDSCRTSGRATVTLGRSAGSQLYHELRDAKFSVRIMSPYIKRHLIELLLELQQKGVTVTLLTSEDVSKRRDVAPLLVRQHCTRDAAKARTSQIGFLASVLFLVAAFGVMLYSPLKGSYQYTGLGVLLSLALVIYFRTMRWNSYSYSFSIPRLRVFTSRYVLPPGYDLSRALTPHAKVYVIDNLVAHVGSVNLTEEGLFDNLEVSVRIDTPQAVEDLAQYLDTLYLDQRWLSYEPTSWGKTLYPQPSR